MSAREEKIMRLSLLTRAAWEEGLPPPLSKAAFARMLAGRMIEGLVLRNGIDEESPQLQRARLLLGRCRRVAECLEAYERRGYEMILPEDPAWPKGLLRIGKGMPQFLFLRGKSALLAQRRIALAGSREIAVQTRRLAEAAGRAIAAEGYAMVCGGARGVDDAAQQALLARGGSLILVPAMPVETLLGRYPYLREALDSGRLLIACDALPDEPFSAAKALARNHTIYALGDAALVVASRNGVGGSWRGATDCLREGYAPLGALDGEHEDLAGNRALHVLGAAHVCPDNPIAPQLMRAAVRQTDLFTAMEG